MASRSSLLLLSLALAWLSSALAADATPKLLRSAKSGPWSAGATWEGGQPPAAGARVQVRPGHVVTYDVKSDEVVRSIHVGGTLSFARDRDTLLAVGLIKIQPGENASEDGFGCDEHAPELGHGQSRPALEVGTPEEPIPTGRTAMIRLSPVAGLDEAACPAIICCGGRMDFHGAPLSRTWVKLGGPAKAGEREIMLTEPVTGWRVGDRVIVTATVRQNKQKKTFKPHTSDDTQTEERQIAAIAGDKLTLDRPLAFDHVAEGNYRADVANLSRNVIVESAQPDGVRGHTMYHRHSAGAISYAEFRHLGKKGVLGRYSLHFHLVGDTMRGSYVLGASIWDSHNRWLTVHGTNYLVVRDCVGYRSLGHGFFLEDATEVYNVLDRNLAVQALSTEPLPKQIVPFDKNDGSGFWWANCLNSFTRNVACDCDEYGYFFQAAKTDGFSPALDIQQPDGGKREIDIRTLPFVRFEDNETHCQRRHGFNLGGGVPFGTPNVGGVGPDAKHPYVIRNFRAWNVHWAIHPVSPSVLLERLDVHQAEYGVWRPVYNRHVYRDLSFDQVPDKLQYAFTDGPPPTDAAGLEPTDDLPPATVITHVMRTKEGLRVRGTASDNGVVAKVIVNGQEAKATRANFAEWEIVLEAANELSAHAVDAAGNTEPRPHRGDQIALLSTASKE